eukprot:7877181-Prorocentrum_lima.AAC.1
MALRSQRASQDDLRQHPEVQSTLPSRDYWGGYMTTNRNYYNINLEHLWNMRPVHGLMVMKKKK